MLGIMHYGAESASTQVRRIAQQFRARPVISSYMDERTPTKRVLSRNLRHLMKMRDWTQQDLSKKSGVSQRTISNMLTEEKVPTLDTVDKVAAAFGLNLWHMIMPKLVEDLENGSSIRGLIDDYFGSDPAGKRLILQVADREAEYNKAS